MNNLAFIQNLRAPELLIIGLFLLLPSILCWLLIRHFYTRSEENNNGFSRLKYILWMIGIGIIFITLISQSSQSDAQPLSLFAFLISLYPLSQRIKNIGFSSSWILLSFVPILNVWLGLFALCCPPLKRKIKQKNTGSIATSAAQQTWRIAKNGKELKRMDLASIKLSLINKSIEQNDTYWDDSLNDWIPLYCHPNIDKNGA
jgi:hypothetical protein